MIFVTSRSKQEAFTLCETLSIVVIVYVCAMVMIMTSTRNMRELLELMLPASVLEQILQQHAGTDADTIMQQLLNNMYPEDVQAVLFSKLGFHGHKGNPAHHGHSKSLRRYHSAAAEPGPSTSRSEIDVAPSSDRAEQALVQNWDLRFPEQTEAAFGWWFTQAQTKTDEFAAAGGCPALHVQVCLVIIHHGNPSSPNNTVFVLLASSAYALVAKYLAPQYGMAAWLQMLPSLCITMLLGIAAPLAQRTAPSWYATHREPLIAILRALNVLQVLAHKRVFPWVHMGGTLPLALLISTGTLPLAAPAIRHRVRFSLHIQLHSILSLLCAVSVLSHANGDLLRAQQGLVSVLLAWVVPSVVVYVMESEARRAFASSYHERITSARSVDKLIMSGGGYCKLSAKSL